MIKITNLKKNYTETQALRGVSLHVRRGELFGLIGPDGAGKTSLMRILMSLLLPDGGEVLMNGCDVVRDYRQVRASTGYMPGKFSLYPDLTVQENLEFFAAVFDTTIEKNYELIKDIYQQIEPFKDRRAGKLSGGMKQKLALSCAMIHRPEILILDEPTTGVDAVSRKEFWQMLHRLKAQGLTILVSTPYMDEATLCDRIALIHSGEILSVDTPQQLMNSFPEDLWTVRTSSTLYITAQKLKQFDKLISVNSFGQTLHVVSPKGIITADDIQTFLEKQNEKNIEIEAVSATVEDVFMLFSVNGQG